MKKILVVFLSLLMVFLMVPILPNAAYAAEMPQGIDALREEMARLDGFNFGFPDVRKITGASRDSAGTVAKTPPMQVTPEPVPIDGTSFVDGTIPAEGWTTIDADGDGYSWVYAREVSSWFYSLDSNNGESVVSASYINGVGPLNPDNWLVSPAITVPEGQQLHYFVRPEDADYGMEHYAVYVSTSPKSFGEDTLVFEETLPGGMDAFEARTIDLTKYAGKTVYVAFRHFDCTDEYWLVLDGIGLSKKGFVPVVPEPGPAVLRIHGDDRYATSVKIAEQLLFDAGASYFPNAIIATGDNFADALAGSALSIGLYAPILLISNKVPATIDNAIDFIKNYVDPGGIVVILGGDAVVPTSVDKALDKLGYLDVEKADASYEGGITVRFAGEDRYETNLMVLTTFNLQGDDSLFVCNGNAWPDAATASATGLPLMLVPGTGLTKDQLAFLDGVVYESENPGNLYFCIVGGDAVVSEDVEKQLLPFEAAEESIRLGGENRAETAVMVAKLMYSTYDPYGFTFAYGRNYPDCVAGGFLSWFFDCPILYGDGAAPDTYVAADAPFVQAYPGLTRAYVLGGPTLVPDQFVVDLLKPNMVEPEAE